MEECWSKIKTVLRTVGARTKAALVRPRGSSGMEENHTRRCPRLVRALRLQGSQPTDGLGGADHLEQMKKNRPWKVNFQGRPAHSLRKLECRYNQLHDLHSAGAVHRIKFPVNNRVAISRFI